MLSPSAQRAHHSNQLQESLSFDSSVQPAATLFSSSSWISHFFKFISWKMSTGAARRHGNHTHKHQNRSRSESDWPRAAHRTLWHTLARYLTRTNSTGLQSGDCASTWMSGRCSCCAGFKFRIRLQQDGFGCGGVFVFQSKHVLS